MGMPKVWVLKDTTFFAKYKINNWAVAFDANGGTGEMSPVSHDEGIFMLPECKFTPPPNSHFVGWSLSATGEVIPAAFIDLVADTILYAKWAKDTFTITFYANGGTGAKNPVEVPYGEYTLPAVPYHYPGKKNIGWAYTPTGRYIDTETIFVDRDINLYAVYQSIYISFNANGGAGTMPTIELATDKYYLPECKFASPSKNHEFIGWSYTSDGDVIEESYIEPDRDVILYARWEIFYSVSLYLEDTSGRVKTEQVHKIEGYKFKLPQTPPFTPLSGYSFKGWSYSPNGEIISEKEITVSEDIILYGVCYCIITLLPNGGVGGSILIEMKKGETFSPPAECPFAPPEKYIFNYWSLSSEGETPVEETIIIEQPISLYAIWKLYIIKLTLHPNGGYGTIYTEDHIVGTYTLPEVSYFTPRSPNKCIGWGYTPSGPKIGTSTIELSQDTTLYAIYRPIQVSFDRGRGTGDMPTVSANSYNYAWPPCAFTPPARQYFIGWSLSPGGEVIKASTVYITDDTILYANYSNNWTTAYHYLPNGGIGEEIIYRVGTFQSVPILRAGTFQPIDDNHYFIGWHLTGRSKVFTNPPTVNFATTDTGDLYFTAIWYEHVCTITLDSNNGLGQTQEIKVAETDSYNLPRNPFQSVAPNLLFIGWSNTPNGQPLSSPQSVHTSRTYYAVWAEANQSITWSIGEGTGEDVTVYQFAGWQVRVPYYQGIPPVGKALSHWRLFGANIYPGRIKTVSSGIPGSYVATPVFVDYNHSVSFDPNGGTGIMDVEIVGDRMSYTIPPCTFWAPSGKAFIGWSTTKDGKILLPSTITVSSDLVLYAIWG